VDQFSLVENVLYMPGNNGFIPLKQLRQLVKGEPASLPAKCHFQPRLSVLGLVEEEFGGFRLCNLSLIMPMLLW